MSQVVLTYIPVIEANYGVGIFLPSNKFCGKFS